MYKRQIIHITNEIFIRDFQQENILKLQNLLPVSYTHLISEFNYEFSYTVLSVSYTHLDVYKRQIYSCRQDGLVKKFHLLICKTILTILKSGVAFKRNFFCLPKSSQTNTYVHCITINLFAT